MEEEKGRSKERENRLFAAQSEGFSRASALLPRVESVADGAFSKKAGEVLTVF